MEKSGLGFRGVWGNVGTMEKSGSGFVGLREYWGRIGIMEKKMET